MNDPRRYACSSSVKHVELPQPPKGYAPGEANEGRPICERCAREGGIVRFGKHNPPERSAIHPNHVAVDRAEKRKGETVGQVTRTIHKGPREALCAFHVELVTWETSPTAPRTRE